MAIIYRLRSQMSKPPKCEQCHEPMRCLRIERDKTFWRCSFCYCMTYVHVKEKITASAGSNA
jgi:hypothetical protein